MFLDYNNCTKQLTDVCITSYDHFCYHGNSITRQKHPYPYNSNTSSAPTIFHC